MARGELYRAVFEHVRATVDSPFGEWHRVPALLGGEHDPDWYKLKEMQGTAYAQWMMGCLSETQLIAAFTAQRDLADVILRRRARHKESTERAAS